MQRQTVLEISENKLAVLRQWPPGQYFLNENNCPNLSWDRLGWGLHLFCCCNLTCVEHAHGPFLNGNKPTQFWHCENKYSQNHYIPQIKLALGDVFLFIYFFVISNRYLHEFWQKLFIKRFRFHVIALIIRFMVTVKLLNYFQQRIFYIETANNYPCLSHDILFSFIYDK